MFQRKSRETETVEVIFYFNCYIEAKKTSKEKENVMRTHPELEEVVEDEVALLRVVDEGGEEVEEGGGAQASLEPLLMQELKSSWNKN
jgi:hypothetical protein